MERVIPFVPISEDTDGIDMTTLLLLKPTLNAPKASNVIEPAAIAPDEVTAVVFPTAKIVCGPAATVAADNIIVLDEYPIDRGPVAENDKASGNADDVDDEIVVLPTAYRLSEPTLAGAEITTLELETPTETMPAPSKETEPAAITPLDTDDVVFPTANILRSGFVAAVDADITRIPDPAAVVDTPTETIPAPDIDILDSVWVLDEEIAVVLPDAK